MLDEDLVGRSAELGKWFLQELALVSHPEIVEVRGIGLLAGIELRTPARPYCERLQHKGMLCKETHDQVIRIAPPLVVARDDLEWALEQVRAVFAEG